MLEAGGRWTIIAAIHRRNIPRKFYICGLRGDAAWRGNKRRFQHKASLPFLSMIYYKSNEKNGMLRKANRFHLMGFK